MVVYMITSPKISVIVPAYNAEKYISRCLNGLLQQTYQDWEAQVVDNDSKDKTAEIIQDFAQKDQRIKYHTQKIKGPAAARNMGLDNAQSEYLMFCDADDWYEPGMCEKMLKIMSDPSIDFAICHQNIIMEGTSAAALRANRSREWPYQNSNSAAYLDEKLKAGVKIQLWNKIFRTQTVKKYGIRFPDGHFSDDDVFTFCYLSVSSRAYFLNERLYNRALVAGSIMDRVLSVDLCLFDLVDRVYSTLCLYRFLKKHDIFNSHKAFFNEIFLRENRWTLPRLSDAMIEDYLYAMRGYMLDVSFNTDDLSTSALKILYESILAENVVVVHDLIRQYCGSPGQWGAERYAKTLSFEQENVYVS